MEDLPLLRLKIGMRCPVDAIVSAGHAYFRFIKRKKFAKIRHMFAFPKIEKVTRDATIVHFFLLFGYKIFSLYFPLYLVSRNFSLPEVGYTYLLIYLPIVVFSPFVGFLSHKINPALLASVGISGYGIYALGMIFVQNHVLFYLCQVLLGISAALFFVATRAILMGSYLENPDRAFGWFYSAPFYADAVAPAVGAFFIWQFGFVGVFVFSLILQFICAIFCYSTLKKQSEPLLDGGFNHRDARENYSTVLRIIKSGRVLPFALVSLSVLFLAGFYRAFFVLFLKDELFWSQGLILVFISLVSVLFLPLSLFLIRQLGRSSSERNIVRGGLVSGGLSVLFGAMLPALNFLMVLLIDLGRLVSSLICNAGRSGLISRSLKEKPEEAGAIDTVFAPLGVALGAFVSGLIIVPLGYGFLFILGGVPICLISLSVRFVKKENLM